MYLIESALSRPHPTCRDNCIYSKAADSDNENCFQNVNKIEAANIQCKALNTSISTASKEILPNTTMVGFGPSGGNSGDTTTMATEPSTKADEGTIHQTSKNTKETNKIPSTEETTTIFSMSPGILLQTTAAKSFSENSQGATKNSMYTVYTGTSNIQKIRAWYIMPVTKIFNLLQKHPYPKKLLKLSLF